MAIWVIKEGIREGPYEDQDVRELIYEGTYAGSEPAMRDGDPEPQTLNEVLARDAGPLPPALPEEAVIEDSAPGATVSEEPPPLPAPAPELVEVRVVDFRMPFGSMVVFLIKLALASIPALLVVALVGALVWSGILAFTAALIAGLMHHH